MVLVAACFIYHCKTAHSMKWRTSQYNLNLPPNLWLDLCLKTKLLSSFFRRQVSHVWRFRLQRGRSCRRRSHRLVNGRHRGLVRRHGRWHTHFYCSGDANAAAGWRLLTEHVVNNFCMGVRIARDRLQPCRVWRSRHAEDVGGCEPPARHRRVGRDLKMKWSCDFVTRNVAATYSIL